MSRCGLLLSLLFVLLLNEKIIPADWPEEEEVEEAAVNEAEQLHPSDDEHHDHDHHGEPHDQQGDNNEHGDHLGALPHVPKRRRCATCYREAGDRRRGMSVKRVLTSCRRCGKPYCANHLRLYCSGCDVAQLPQAPAHLHEQAEGHAHYERERQELQTTVERQRQQIDELQQQVRVLIPLVS